MTNSSSKQRQSVALVSLGENVSIDLTKLCNKLNSLQNSWYFQVVRARPRLGDPDVDGVWYSIDRLLRELQEHKPATNFDIVIGLTHVRLENREESLGVPDKDYFSLNDNIRYAVVTEAMRQWNAPSKDLYQYFAFLIIGEVLQIAAGKNLCHQAKEVCLFDDCADREEFRPAIERSRLCTSICQANLANAQVGQDVVDDVQRVLRWCRKNRWARSFQLTAANPFVSLIIGSAVGWAASAYVPREWYKIVFCVVFLVFALVLVSNRYSQAYQPSSK